MNGRSSNWKAAITLHLPSNPAASGGQAAIHFPMRSGEEVSSGFTTKRNCRTDAHGARPAK